jgi:hypothetical protein
VRLNTTPTVVSTPEGTPREGELNPMGPHRGKPGLAMLAWR